MTRRGLFGGTFDPPHIGHIMAAQVAYESLPLDIVEFIPAGEPPHKNVSQVSSADVRVTLVQAAISSFPYFSLSLEEISRKGPSFTVDTLQSLQKKYASDELYWFVGGDMLADLPTWREPQKIVEIAHLVVAPRPHVDLECAVYVVRDQFPDVRLTILDMPMLDISSSWIKERLRQNRRVDPLLMPTVYELICQRELYQT